MTHDSARPHRVIARRIKQLRRRRGWSAQRLAEEMSAVGVSWDRAIVANFETGRRSYVTVEEALALAYVLHVAPVHLLVPTGDEVYRLFPQPFAAAATEPPVAAIREWFIGRRPLPGTDIRTYHSEVPEAEFYQRKRGR